MAKYPNITLTNAGLSMIAESQGSGQLIFTNIKLGDGSLVAGENIKALTAVKNPLLTANISNIDTKTAGQTTLTATISNAAVTSGFFAREMGVYAKVGADGVEKLYAYTNAGNYADYMPDKTAQINENQIKITLIVGNAANVTAIIDSSIVYPTKEVMTESIAAAVAAHDSKAATHAPAFAAHNADIESHSDIRAALKKAGGVPIGTITARLSKKPEAGELAVDTGALVSRATYPDLWAWVQTNAPLISEADWQAQAAAQTSVGAYSTGDGSTTFRLPRILDYMRGGLTADVGKWQGDAIRNIMGKVGATWSTAPTGAFSGGVVGNNNNNGTGGAFYDVSFDASKVVPTADENRPKTIKVLYCVKAFDAETNQGLIDITALASDVSGKQITLGYIRAWDQKASGTSGGTFTAGAWRTRDLNQLKTYGNISGVSLINNQLTIPAGSYIVKASAPANNVDGHKTRLRNITAGITISVGSTEQTATPNTSDWIQTNSVLGDIFTVNTTTVLELQHYAQSTYASYGYGSAMSGGEIEIFANIELQKIG